jgi:E3 ubiquitin-protein ligase UBR3
MSAQALMKRGKREMARCVKEECSKLMSHPHLNELLSYLLDPQNAIDDFDRIDWCRWLLAGGESFDEFAQNGKMF